MSRALIFVCIHLAVLFFIDIEGRGRILKCFSTAHRKGRLGLGGRWVATISNCTGRLVSFGCFKPRPSHPPDHELLFWAPSGRQILFKAQNWGNTSNARSGFGVQSQNLVRMHLDRGSMSILHLTQGGLGFAQMLRDMVVQMDGRSRDKITRGSF